MKPMNQSRFLSGNLYESTKSQFITIIVCIMLFSLPLGKGRGWAQNVGISATGVNPDNSAMLDVTSNTKGMLIPRMTGDEKYAIPSPATGLLIYQTDTVGFWYYDGTKWIPLVSSTSSTASPSNAGWLTTGNIGTAWDKNFLGTTDNVSLRLRTNDTEKMIVDSLGRVGIGIAAPAYKLDILDSNSAGSGVTSRTINNFQIRTEANTTAASASGINNTLLYRMTEATPNICNGYGAQNTAYTDGAYTFNSLQGAQNTAYITGTASATWYQAFGSINQSALNSTAGTLTNGFGSRSTCLNNSSGTITNAYGTQSYVMANTGSSGTITNAYGSYSFITNNSTTGGSIIQAIGVQSFINKAATASAIGTGYLYYGNYGSGAATNHYGLYITGEDTNYFSGKVGIGTASPVARLQVNTGGTTATSYTARFQSDGGVAGAGGILFDQNGTNSFKLHTENTGIDDGFLKFSYITAATGAVKNDNILVFRNGNVGIGCLDPKYKLHVVGNMGVVGTIYATAASVSSGVSACSDIRYKKDITPLSHTLDKVLSMQGVNYHWKIKEFPEKQFTADNQIGFIAQELEKIVPEVVMTDKEGYKSVDYSRLTPVLVEAIKELKAENERMLSEAKSRQVGAELRIKNAELKIAKLEASMSLLLQQSTTAAAKK